MKFLIVPNPKGAYVTPAGVPVDIQSSEHGKDYADENAFAVAFKLTTKDAFAARQTAQSKLQREFEADLAKGYADKDLGVNIAIGDGDRQQFNDLEQHLARKAVSVLQRIAERVEANEGKGAVKEAIEAAIQRLIGFEVQLGPFAVAQLRLLASIVNLTGGLPRQPPRMFVTDTLGNSESNEEWIPSTFPFAPIAKSRREANRIKRDEPITVVIGNPPYKEKAMGRGGWVETGDAQKPAPLLDWMPPREWGIGAHAKHLRNLYVYFWRWATWKVFDQDSPNNTGIVCFITVAGFLSGPGFQKMRDYLRRTCDDIWIIDCSPEGHQPEVATRIFQGVQHPVCIVLASRSPRRNSTSPAIARFISLPAGKREDKFAALAKITLEEKNWTKCPTDWRAPFLPASTGTWASYPALEHFFIYNGCGVQPKRVWVIAPDAQSLYDRWQRLIEAPLEEKERLFHPTLRDGKPADRHIRSVVNETLLGTGSKPKSLINETSPCITPVRYAFRSFNRQWIIPDIRVITQPNAELWRSYSEKQVFLTAFTQTSPTSGPALTFSALIPDLHHYKGSFGGRVFPLWRNAKGTKSNIRSALLTFLSNKYRVQASPEDLLAYVAAIASHPGYTKRFKNDLAMPGLRIPLTVDRKLFAEAVTLGKTVIWLHSFGERFADKHQGRPPEPPRLAPNCRPKIPKNGSIPGDADTLAYDPAKQRLLIGSGYVENVSPAVWNYEVSGKQVLSQWFSYRRKNRERPIIGDRRPPSPLGDVQPDHWLAEYTTELLNVINVLGCLRGNHPTHSRLRWS